MATWPGTWCERSIEKGVLMFTPGRLRRRHGEDRPPLVITEAAILESIAVLEEAFAEALVAQSAVA